MKAFLPMQGNFVSICHIKIASVMVLLLWFRGGEEFGCSIAKLKPAEVSNGQNAEGIPLIATKILSNRAMRFASYISLLVNQSSLSSREC